MSWPLEHTGVCSVKHGAYALGMLRYAVVSLMVILLADGFYRIVAPHFVAGVAIEAGRPVACAPILRRSLAGNRIEVRPNWQIERLDLTTPPMGAAVAGHNVNTLSTLCSFSPEPIRISVLVGISSTH